MTNSTRKCQQDYHNLQEIQYYCKYAKCKLTRLLCSKCALETTHMHEQEDNSHIVKIQEHDEELLQQIRCSRYRVKEIINANDDNISIGAISNSLKYIALSQKNSRIVNVWSYQTCKHIKSIVFKQDVSDFKFTEDSRYLYVGTYQKLSQLQATQGFKKKEIKFLHRYNITSIYCISNYIILTSSDDGSIIKTDFINKKQILKIQAHSRFYSIPGLDYNRRRNMIASGACDRTIKLWNGIKGSLIINKYYAYNNPCGIKKVLFIINTDQLISLDTKKYIIIWNIKYQAKNLEIFKVMLQDKLDVSLVLDQQYLLFISQFYYIRVYNHSFECVKEYYLGDFPISMYCISNQPNSLRAILFVARFEDKTSHVFVCKFQLD